MDDAERELDCLLTVGGIAGKVAHEINNPLAGIHNAFLLVKDAIPATHPYFTYVAVMEREIRRIAAVTQRFANVYRPERDASSGVALSSIVSDAVQTALATSLLPGDAVRIEATAHDPYPYPAGPLRHALIQLLQALLRSDATERPQLVLAVKPEADGWCCMLSGPAVTADITLPVHAARLLASLHASFNAGGGGVCSITLPRTRTSESAA